MEETTSESIPPLDVDGLAIFGEVERAEGEVLRGEK